MANTYTLISSNTLGSDTASVTFSSIPGTYTDLVLIVSAQSIQSNDNYLKVIFNGDTSSIYSYTYLRGDGSSVTSSRGSANPADYSNWAINQINLTNIGSSFSNSEMYLPNYTSSNNKPIMYDNAQEANTATGVVRNAQASLYRNTSAITSILLSGFFGGFKAGSSFYLYGIKNS